MPGTTLRTAAPVALAAALLASLAAMGHSGAGAGPAGVILLASDGLHLIAAGAWIGALLPLALLLGALRRGDLTVGLAVARNAVSRFSTLGTACVGAVLATGLVNSTSLVGTMEALTQTGFGQLLLAKLTLVALVLGLAAINRWRLTPELDRDQITAEIALRLLTRTTLLEAAVGLAIVAIVAALGTVPPAAEFHMSHQH